MSDVFNRRTDVFGGSFPADAARVTFPALQGGAGAEIGMLMQNLQFSYQQQVTRLYELGSNAVYYVGGRTAGNGSVQRVIGPRKLSKEFYKTYGDVCFARTNTLFFSVNAGCDNPLSSTYTASFVVITALAVTVTAQDMMINESLQMIFSSFQAD